MAFGIKIVNSNTGSIQIDENYRNLVLLTKASIVTANYVPDDNGLWSTGMASGFSAYQSTLVYKPALAVLQTSYKFAKMAYGGLAFKAPVGTAVGTLYGFGLIPADASQGGFGLKVLDASGAMTFHSDYKPLRVHAILQGADYTSALPSISLPSGRQFAAGFMKWCGRYDMDKKSLLPGGQMRDWEMDQVGMGISCSGNSFSAEGDANMKFVSNYRTLRQEFGGPYQSRDFTDRSYAILIADVTNY